MDDHDDVPEHAFESQPRLHRSPNTMDLTKLAQLAQPLHRSPKTLDLTKLAHAQPLHRSPKTLDLTELSQSINRSPKTLDLPELCRSSRKRFSRTSISFATDYSENHDLDCADFLCMAPSKRSKRQSLSTVSNQPARHFDGSEEPKLKKPDLVQEAHEQLSMTIIDREIIEWQEICRTGRPIWWLPETRWARAKSRNPWLAAGDASPREWFGDLESGPDPEYEVKRRAISDSYMNGPGDPNDLAHMVAIQLLSSCFTLPLTPMKGTPPPNFTTFDKDGRPNLPDPRMISSLRLHTQYRYSPCFGHEQRNPSPMETWIPTLDGSASLPTPPPSGSRTPQYPTSTSFTSRYDVNSYMARESMESVERRMRSHQSSYRESEDVNAVDETMGWNRRQRIARRSRDRNNRRRASRAHPLSQDGSGDYVRDGRIKPSRLQKMNYRLQPIIRSEPHPVFVQPVKELVVKRWRTFRRRFGGSLHGALPSHASDLSEASMSGISGVSSPVMSTDARTRRLRAQERGDISNTVDSIKHYNSPISEVLNTASGATSPFWVDSRMTTPALPLADPLVAAAALAIAESGIPRAPPNSTDNSTPSMAELTIAPPDEPLFNMDSKIEAAMIEQSDPAFMLPIPMIMSSLPRPSLFYTQTKRSMLSEMHTPEDLELGDDFHATPQDRSGLSAAGSALASSPDASPDLKPQNVAISMSETSDVLKGVLSATVQKRPSLLRTTTSGTQIFHPSDEGVEVDGLPVGPSRHVWDVKGKRREGTYL